MTKKRIQQGKPNGLALKTRMVKAEAIRTFLYGCSTWAFHQEHYSKLRTIHHDRVLVRIIGAQRKRSNTVRLPTNLLLNR